ncbi:amidoligase family protein [Pistricoccus aurantiacus]|uniref:amidoligase family protein n=1 Tax=Pistricoccus aurantiacus TaxID=1883414 RepID=UPI00362DC669
MKPQAPPVTTNTKGETRRVGVEIEFAGIEPHGAAELVAEHFAGRMENLSPHRLKVVDTRWGDFTIELDAQYAHPDSQVIAHEQPLEEDDAKARQRHHERIERHLRTRELIGDMVSGLVPTEIVCPPMPWDTLGELDNLFASLRNHGAKGTEDSLLYGFGLHLNPEVPSLEVKSVLAHLRAYLLLAASLRKQIDIDITREMLPHANPFPRTYALKLLDPRYAPDLDTLIKDYLLDNPTRNRELDMLPLFAFLRPEYPSELLRDVLIKPRPTFHYRLPNARLSAPDWNATVEWNRWVQVERLAADTKRLDQRTRAYFKEQQRSFIQRWRNRLRQWMHR